MKPGLIALATMVFLQAGVARADEVIIKNDLPGRTLDVQCYGDGGAKDLGYESVLSGLSYSFSFDPSWWGRDVYACDFYAEGFSVKHMNVYEGANFFGDFCLCRVCHWTVTKFGFDCENGQYQEQWKV